MANSFGKIISSLCLLFLVSTQAGKAESNNSNPSSSLNLSTVKEIVSVVPNFGVVSERLYRGGQPVEGGLAALKKVGVKTIVNLRDGIEDIESEKKIASKLGLNFVSIPMSVFKTATNSQVDKFLKVVRDPGNGKVFVHCRQGMDRCGTMVAMYRLEEQNWTGRKAYDEMLHYGFKPFLIGLRWSVFAHEAAILSARALPLQTPGRPMQTSFPLQQAPVQVDQASIQSQSGQEI